MNDDLTKANIERFVAAGVPDGKPEASLLDGMVRGLALRMRLSGVTTWQFSYRPHGSKRGAAAKKIRIGDYPTIGLDDARKAARQLAGEVASRKDPAADLRAERMRAKSALPLVLDAYEADLFRRRIVNTQTTMSTLRRGLAPLSTREIGSLSRRDFVTLIDAIEASGRPGAAADLRKHSRSLLEFAVSKGLAHSNPLAGMRRPRTSRAERLEDTPKGRALSDSEVAAVWASAGSLGPFGGLVKIGLLTGLRRSELSGLTRADILSDRIRLEAPSTKMGARHEIPITPLVRAILDAQPRTTSPYIFPGRAGVRMLGWSKLIPRARAASGVAFGLHDLRRTCRTLMSRLGVAVNVAELAIGHRKSGLVGLYDRNDHWAERIVTFTKISEHVENLCTAGAPASAAASEASEQVT
jgi:integrase